MATLPLVFHTCIYSNEFYTKTNLHLTQSSNAFPTHLNESPHLCGVCSLVFTAVQILLPVSLNKCDVDMNNTLQYHVM